jgi:DICT domain-containing protein
MSRPTGNKTHPSKARYVAEDEERIAAKIQRDHLVKAEARRYMNQAIEASQRLLLEAKLEDGTIEEQEMLLINEAVLEAMQGIIDAQEKLDKWRAIMLVLLNRRIHP